MRVVRLLRSFVFCQLIGLAVWIAIGAALWTIAPRIAVTHTYANLPKWRVQEIYHLPVTRDAMFREHKDPIADWSEPAPSFLYHHAEQFFNWLVVTLPARVVPAPLRVVQLLQGPAQVQVLRSLVLFGVPDLLADRVLSVSDLHKAVIANAPAQAAVLRAGILPKQAGADVALAYPNFDTLPLGKLERLMSFALSMGFFEEVSYRGSRIYVHNPQSVVLRTDHPNNLNHLLFHFSNEAYLAWHNLFDAILSPEDIGGVIASDFESPVGEDAALAGSYSTPSSAKVLQENVKARDRAVAALRNTLTQEQPATVGEKAKRVQTAWQKTFGGEELWSFFKSRPTIERNFAQAMSQVDFAVNRALIADYAWDKFSNEMATDTVVDVGGAEGSFLAAVLTAYPSVPHGVLFDLEGNIASARSLWSSSPSAPYASLVSSSSRSISLVSGDFFSASSIPLPRSTTATTKYVLRQILHDWNDKDAARILHNLRVRLTGYEKVAQVIIIEVNKGSPETSPTRSWIDGQMLVCCNAKERTAAQWDVLLRVTGWRIKQQVQTRSLFSIMELEMDTQEQEQTAMKENNKQEKTRRQTKQTTASSKGKEEL